MSISHIIYDIFKFKMKPRNPQTSRVQTSKTEKLLLRLIDNKRKTLQIALFAFLVLALTFFLLFVKQQKKNRLMTHAQQSMRHLSHHMSRDEIKRLCTLSDRQPSLQPKLDASLAQLHLNSKHYKEAHHHINRVIKRQKSSLPFVHSLNEMAFLIEKKQFKSALDLGYALKVELKQKKQMQTLYTYHLLQLAALEKKLGHKDQYQQLIAELSKLYSQETLLPSFQMGQLNLLSFTLKKENAEFIAD